MEFDHTGNYLATGDKGGRVVLFERNETVSPSNPVAPYRVKFADIPTTYRRRRVNTNSILSFNLTNPNSTTSNP